MAKKKHQPPSKIKYDTTHPVISIRVDQKTKFKLDELKRLSGKSLGDILREALKVQAPSIKEAFTRGNDKGRAMYGVHFKCSVCGETIWVNTPKLREAAAGYFERYRWGHEGCLGTSHLEARSASPSPK